MTWHLNNNNPGAAEAAMKFAWSTDGIDGTYFTYGDEDRQRATTQISSSGQRVILCEVVCVGGVPNKVITGVEIYPQQSTDEVLVRELELVMSAADTNLS